MDPAMAHPSTLVDTVAASTACAYAIQWLKKSPSFDWLINKESKYAPIVISAFMAAAASAGIHWEFKDATDTLIITGLNTAAVFHMAIDFFKSFIFNHLAYEKVVRDTSAQG